MTRKSIDQVIPILEENGFLINKWEVAEFKDKMSKTPKEIWLSNGLDMISFILDNPDTRTYVAQNWIITDDEVINDMIDKINN